MEFRIFVKQIRFRLKKFFGLLEAFDREFAGSHAGGFSPEMLRTIIRPIPLRKVWRGGDRNPAGYL